jgi:hypothetical protein
VLAASELSGAQGARIGVLKPGRKPAQFAHLQARTFRTYSAGTAADLADFRRCETCETAPGQHQRDERGATSRRNGLGPPGGLEWAQGARRARLSRHRAACQFVALGVAAATSASSSPVPLTGRLPARPAAHLQALPPLRFHPSATSSASGAPSKPCQSCRAASTSGGPIQVYGLAPVTVSVWIASACRVWAFPQHQRRAPPRFRTGPVNLPGAACRTGRGQQSGHQGPQVPAMPRLSSSTGAVPQIDPV